MTEDTDDNPFNGVQQGPTNEELLANWKTGMLFVAPVIFAWLFCQSLLGYAWANFFLEQGAVLWFCLALLTWSKKVVWFVLTLVLALFAAGRAFVAVWRE